MFLIRRLTIFFVVSLGIRASAESEFSADMLGKFLTCMPKSVVVAAIIYSERVYLRYA